MEVVHDSQNSISYNQIKDDQAYIPNETGIRVKKDAVKLTNGDLYEGDWLGDKRDGYGIQT